MISPINPNTQKAVEAYLLSPGQAIGLIGQKWLNKSQLAIFIAERLLNIKAGSLEAYPYYISITNEDLSSIGIDEIRAINEFLILKVPNDKAINRLVIINRAERLTLEAQNALLKSLEEPPLKTVFILTSESTNSLLPTIISRLNLINVHKPLPSDLIKYYQELGYQKADINQALLIADGLPGLMDQLIINQDNPITEALTIARSLLSSTTFERLSSINDLSKDKRQLKSVLFVIKQMARIGVKSDDQASANRWRRILAATLESEQKLSSNVQLKLLLTDYVLNLV